MTWGQFFNFCFNLSHGLALHQALFRALLPTIGVGRAQDFEQVKTIFIGLALRIAEIDEHGLAGFAPPKPIQGAIGEDALKQQWQFIGRLVAIVFGQLHHAVLHDVQCGFFIPHVVERALESTFFHALQKKGEFAFGCQFA